MFSLEIHLKFKMLTGVSSLWLRHWTPLVVVIDQYFHFVYPNQYCSQYVENNKSVEIWTQSVIKDEEQNEE